MTESQTTTVAVDCEHCGATIDNPIEHMACPDCGTDMIEAILG